MSAGLYHESRVVTNPSLVTDEVEPKPIVEEEKENGSRESTQAGGEAADDN